MASSELIFYYPNGVSVRQVHPPEIAIFEEHPLVACGLRGVLIEHFFSCHLLGCSQNLMEHVDVEIFDLIILSATLIEVNPFDLAKKLKRKFPEKKIIFNIRCLSVQIVQLCIECGADGIVAENSSVEEWCFAVDSVLNHKNYHSAGVKSLLLTNQLTSRLSPREVDILQSLTQGLTAKEIGKKLHITPKTVERHKSNMMGKLLLHNQVDLAVYAIREGFVSL